MDLKTRCRQQPGVKILFPSEGRNWLAFRWTRTQQAQARPTVWWVSLISDATYRLYSFFLDGPAVPCGPPLLNGLLPFIHIPTCSPLIRNCPLLNIYPNIFPPSRSWSSSCPYALRLTIENLLDWCDHSNSIFSLLWGRQCPCLHRESVLHSCIWLSNGHCYM
jgi:hypothetical protein